MDLCAKMKARILSLCMKKMTVQSDSFGSIWNLHKNIEIQEIFETSQNSNGMLDY